MNDVFGLFKKKGRISMVLAPSLGDLPTFPSPAELDELRLEPKMPVPALPKAMQLKMPPVPSMHNLKPHIAKHRMERTVQSELNRPVFLKADLIQSVLHDVQTVRGRLDKSERMIARLEEVHDAQGRLLQTWYSTLKEVHDKLLFVDSILFKKGDAHE